MLVFSRFKKTVKPYTLTTSEFSRERCSMEVAPDIWARAAARALIGPFSCTSNRADSLKYSIAV